MTSLYQNKFRVESSRLKNHDYSANGIYFITICTHNKIQYFGEIISSENILSTAGQIANKFWEEIPQHFPIIILDEFVIMPDHIHGILIIDNTRLNRDDFPHVQTPNRDNVETPNLGVSTTTTTTTSSSTITTKHNPNWKRNSIGSIINQYKRICTIEIRKSVHEFKWHSGYYDHIVRSHAELMRIRKYIRENPFKIKNHK